MATFDYSGYDDDQILWIGRRGVSAQQMRRHRGLRPFLVPAHAFGPGRPAVDTRLSRQHRILLTQDMVRHPAINNWAASRPSTR